MLPEVFLRKSGLELRNTQSITTLPTWSLEIRKERRSQVSRLTKVGQALLMGTPWLPLAPGYSDQQVRLNERKGPQQGRLLALCAQEPKLCALPHQPHHY